MLPVESFKIKLFQQDTFSFDITKGRELLCIDSCNHSKILDTNFTYIEADPFLFVKNEVLYLFYESKPWGKDAFINMIYTIDLEHWSKPVTVLKEKCHLSYPYVFEEGGVVYMIPETCGLKEIRLYKATNEELTSFVYYSTIIKETDNSSQISFFDSSVLKKDAKYYLHTSRQVDDKNRLELYISDNIDGPYLEHPDSPIMHDLKFGRNGGSIIDSGNKLYRVAQNCEDSYGGDLGLFEVNELSPDRYEERLVKSSMIKGKSSFYKYGGHHFNIVKYKGKFVLVTDAKEYPYFFTNRLLEKIINKVKK